MEGTVKTKLGRAKEIHNQTRKIIAKVYRLMKRKAKSYASITLKNVLECIVEVT